MRNFAGRKDFDELEMVCLREGIFCTGVMDVVAAAIAEFRYDVVGGVVTGRVKG